VLDDYTKMTMQIISEMPFKIGTLPGNEPLARYLPPLPDGIASVWLKEVAEPGAWVMDPFCASPRLVLEAARAGYRLLVAANNPVARFLLETQAAPPTEVEMQSVLARFASTKVGDQRLELFIRSLYQTHCDNCNTPVQAEVYLWNKGEQTPYARVYHCDVCGQNGEFATTQADITQANQIASNISLHHARALERVAARNDPDRQHAEEALTVYLPRATLALFTMINKLDGLDVSSRQLDILRAMLLTTCDQACSLSPVTGTRPRPKQLSIPARFVEHNLWKILEESIAVWCQNIDAIPVHIWSDQLTQIDPGSIVLYEGPLRELAPHLKDIEIKAVLFALPRPNQAYWTLSALWAGWLWGREAVGPFKSVLRRRRYDWNWHTTALFAALSILSGTLHPGIPIFGLMAENEPSYLSAILIAANTAGMVLKNIAMREHINQAQIVWNTEKHPFQQPKQSPTEAGVETGKQFIHNQGEPVSYDLLQAAIVCGMVTNHQPIAPEDILQSQAITRLNALLQKCFAPQEGFLRIGGNPNNLDTGSWWLKDPTSANTPLADRCEIELVNCLISKKAASSFELDRDICSRFPGLHTPDPILIETILDSYAEKPFTDQDSWTLRQEDAPSQRRQDLNLIRQTLLELGQRLGYVVTDNQSIEWKTAAGEKVLAFYLSASAVINKYLENNQTPPERSILVIPGGRANLLLFKLNHDLRLGQIANSGWRFLKFRHVLRMAANPLLNQENFADQLELDPLTYSTPQLRLF
jgi:hypothetical protein